MLSADKDSANLLRAIVMPSIEGRGETIAQLASRIQSWENLLELARRHGVVPMLYSRLAANQESVPSDALVLVRRAYERNALHCMTNAEELLRILKEFDGGGIRALPFKGVVLGASA